MTNRKMVFTAVAAALATVFTGGAAAQAAPAPPGPEAATVRAMQDQIRKLAVAPTDERAFGDMTGDGKADLMAIGPDGKLWTYPGRGIVYSGTGERQRGYFGRRIQGGTGWDTFSHIVRHGDWDNDGKQDVLATTWRGWLVFYAGTGIASQPVENGVVMGYGWDDFQDLVGIGDGNGDGFDDLIGRKNGTLVKYEGTGKAYPAFRRNTVTAGTGWNGSAFHSVGDWTGDGVSEFVFRNTKQELWLYSGRKGSGFPANNPVKLTDGSFGGAVTNLVGMGDLTSDAGRPALPDLVFTDIREGGLYAIAPDTSETFDGSLGVGWSGYRLF